MTRFLTSRIRRFAIAAVLAGLAVGAFIAQPKVVAPGGGKPPTITLDVPNAATPSQALGSATAKVTPGPEPWYTLFTTGEVVGYIEPCG